MKTTWAFCASVIFILASCGANSSPPASQSEGKPVPQIVVEKEKAERGQPLPPEVKIRLKRDGKENYSWELNGSDVDQILKVNDRLRKQLGGEKSQ